MLQFLLPFLPGLLGSAGAATGIGSALSGLGAAAGGLGALSGLLGGAQQSMAPPMIDMARATGALGQVQDATGGLLTDAYASRNVGGGLLGSMARPSQHGKGYGDMKDMMMMGMMGGQEKEPMPQAPASRYTSNYQPMSKRDPDEEMRRRRLAYQTRRY